jgi:hypothetical protein
MPTKWTLIMFKRIREDLNKLLDAQFIFPIETTQWLSLLVIIPKKNEYVWTIKN